MRIFSSFHDYYDIGLQYGQDPKCVYNREEKEYFYTTKYSSPLPFIQEAFSNDLFYNLAKKSHIYFPKAQSISLYDIDTKLILFCGKIYYINMFGFNCYYSYESLFQAMADTNDKRLLNLIDGKNKYKWKYSFYNNKIKEYETVDKLNSNQDFLNNICRLANFPIIIFTYNKAIVNPKLSIYKFQTVVDPYTAFQEISSFITNVIGIGENETIEIEDKYKITQHGYNKQSFRHPVKL